ncbi:hypothetical protein M2650_01130 [Luteimonas sp. SX5]|uniref:Uncharacterized protein n=1 Tax=Luteimonas galliterrae TaxID=2940486 RepID=A0ABT0MF83_9GAMM|nr:hypothetical protein [Luteimonas galliterrae]MCL1633253.1 hypothetical protein [Luteimonas galliterrae]
MPLTARHYRLAGAALCVFMAAQIFQALCFIFWFPETQAAAEDFAVRTGLLDRTRALAVLFSIAGLAVTYAVFALDRFAKAPLASLLAFTFTMFFVVFEFLHRGLDFVMVSQQWANAYAAEPALRGVLAQRHELWGSFTGAIYFPLMLSGLVAWTCFAIATWNAGPGWLRLASIAFALNALRTLGRLLGNYTGVEWFDFLDSFALYLVLVFLINGMLAIWLFRRAAMAEKPPALSIS